jgi:ATP-dependent DNA ligase
MSQIRLMPELLQEEPISSIQKYIKDSRYGFQEKYNGKRRVIIRDGGYVYCLNKESEVRDLPRSLAAKLLSHPLDRFVLDCELMQDESIKVFDALILGKHLLGGEEYTTRLDMIRTAFGKFAYIEVASLAITENDKRLFAQQLQAENAEGLVLRRLDASYKQGDSRQHKKIKFWRTVDCVVLSIGTNGKASARVGVWHKSKWIEVCGVSLIGKVQPVVGNVVEVKCLYSTPDLHLVQPGLLGIRDDKSPKQCTSDQLTRILNKNWIGLPFGNCLDKITSSR